jgi:uncharacterized protein (TIGR03067 family)
VVGYPLGFEGASARITGPDGTQLYAGHYTVDAAGKPARIDFVQEAGAAEGQAWEGIWRLDGERQLTIVDDAPNPSKKRLVEFTAAKDSGHVMIVFRR